MKTPTIYDIKYAITNESHYFDRQTLKFFGQTMRDFKVIKSQQGNIFIFAPIRDRFTRKFTNSYSFRQFKDNQLVHADFNGLHTYNNIMDYISKH